jgi:DUF971 family protein
MTEAPSELRVGDQGRRLSIVYAAGQRVDLDAEYLRVESPSAEVKGHGPGQAQLVSGKRNVRIVQLETVGSYAVRIVFDDGHSTGIYTWPYLERLAAERATIWQQYLTALAERGLDRGAG